MKKKLYTVSEALPALQTEAFENIKSINRALLVAAGGDIPEKAAVALDDARDLVLHALRCFQSEACGRPHVEELPVVRFKALAEQAQSKFDPLFESLRVLFALPELLANAVETKRPLETR